MAKRAFGKKNPKRSGVAVTPDPDEEAAFAEAVAAVKLAWPLCGDPERVAYEAISRWIVERTLRATKPRLSETLAFNLQDSRLRGYVTAALPHIGSAIAHLPPDKPLFKLSKDQVVDVFVAGIIGAMEASVSFGERSDFLIE